MSLSKAFNSNESRWIYTEEQLLKIRSSFPDVKHGVFTRAPRRYTDLLLNEAYENFEWDVVITHDDVRRTKPDGQGILDSMKHLEIDDPIEVMMIGDSHVDIRAAYHAGCWAVLDKSGFGTKVPKGGYWAMERVPDAILSNPSDVLKVIENPIVHLAELEFQLYEPQKEPRPSIRFDRINHFFPDRTREWVPIYVLGKLFSNHASNKRRSSWHYLTAEIIELKEAEIWPDTFLLGLRNVLSVIASRRSKTVLTVIPAKPGRVPRLERMLDQLRQFINDHPFPRSSNLAYDDSIFYFSKEARSLHASYMSPGERFSSVQGSLLLAEPVDLAGMSFIVLDDVITTGSTMLSAHRLLTESGASQVECLALAKAVRA
jgi:hypothetical protein